MKTVYKVCRGGGLLIEDAMNNLEYAMNDNFAGRQVSVIGPPVIVRDTQSLHWHMIQAFVDIGPARERVENQAE